MTRALVLGGGGPVGIGWELGLAVGLADRGVDVATADAIYGTSAGSFVGAQLALGVDLAETAALLEEMPAALLAASEGMSVPDQMATLMTATEAVASLPAQEAMRALGRLALESDVPSEEVFLGFFDVLEGCEWPRRFSCSAVDTATGEFVVWRHGSDVDLRHAVASSCSLPCVYPSVSIGGRRYMDGGMRSVLNADLAQGHDRALVISVTMLALPDGVSNPSVEAILRVLADELETLRASGCAVEVIEPNPEFLEISGWGISLMDASKALEAYEAGVRQGIEESGRIAERWARSSP